MNSNIFEYNNNEYYFSADYNGTDWIIKLHNITQNHFIPLKVRKNKEYTVKWNEKSKTFSAMRGAEGLFSFCADCIKDNFMMSYVHRIIDNAYKTVKEEVCLL